MNKQIYIMNIWIYNKYCIMNIWIYNKYIYNTKKKKSNQIYIQVYTIFLYHNSNFNY